MGLLGAAVAWDAVQATSLTLMVLCCVWHTGNQDPARRTWSGWTWSAFKEWPLYIRMAIPSCIMICEWCRVQGSWDQGLSGQGL
jgi:MATE family multidrug resistance protein